MRTTSARVPAGRERNAQSGTIAVMMGLLLTGLMGFAAVGFDLSYVRLARLEMKNATDAAAHAAIVRLRAQGDEKIARDKAIEIAKRNTVLGKPLTLQENDVVFGAWNPTTKAFLQGVTPYTSVKINGVRESSATNDGYIKLTFGRVLGFSEASITSDVVASFSNRNFMIEMDITASYICDLDNAIQADLALLDDLHAKNIGGDRISLDVFTGVAKEFTPFQNIRDNYTTIRNTWAGGASYVSFLPGGKTQGITVCNKTTGTITCGSTTYAYPSNPNIQDCSESGPTGYATTLYAGTDIGAAIRAGVAKLKAKTQNWEPRVLIVVTDGSPMTCTAPGGGDHCYTGANPCCSDGFCNQADAVASGKQYRIDACNAAHKILDDAITAADEAASNNVDLFTVKITGSSTDNGAVFAKSLARRRGQGYWISNASQLGSTFQTIVGQVPVSLVQ